MTYLTNIRRIAQQPWFKDSGLGISIYESRAVSISSTHVARIVVTGSECTGKTTLAEALLLASGAIKEAGTVERDDVTDLRTAAYLVSIVLIVALVGVSLWRSEKVKKEIWF